MDLEGRIVEFINSGALRLAWVQKREQRRIRVVDQRGRNSTVPISRVIVVHDTVSEDGFSSVAREIQERIDACITQIDIGLLWDSVNSDRQEFKTSELAETYFGQATPEYQSAIYRRLSQETLYFKRTATGFQARSAEQVSAEKLRISRQMEREQYRDEITRLLRKAMESEMTPEIMKEEGEWPPVLDRLERWMRTPDTDTVGEVLEKIVGKALARTISYNLLIRYGQISRSEDRFLLVRGIPTAFSKEVLNASLSIAPMGATTGRVVCEDLEIFAIDDDETVEIDDALTARKDGSEIVVGIHVADVSLFVKKEDALDREALRRSSTIYLPNISVTMLPPRVATDLASLVKGVPRPTLSVEVRFSETGTLLDFRFFRSVISVTDRIDYSDADTALEKGNQTLSHLHTVAQQLRENRVAGGAQTHGRPTMKVRVRNERISVRRFDGDTPSSLIVSEMMILFNRLAAKHAGATGIPIIFRTQEASSNPPPEIEGLPEPLQFELLRKNFRRSRLSLHPSPHAGLGLDSYTQMSSPIRRYTDLVTQRQFTASLEEIELPYTRQELLDVMTSCEAQEVEMRRLEQTSTTWWTLTYLDREQRNKPLSAIVIDNKGTVELTETLIRARLKHREGIQMGSAITVTLNSVDPEHGEIDLEVC